MIRLVLTFLESSLVILVAQHYHFIDKDRLQVSPWQKAENGFIGKVLDLREDCITEKEEEVLSTLLC